MILNLLTTHFVRRRLGIQSFQRRAQMESLKPMLVKFQLLALNVALRLIHARIAILSSIFVDGAQPVLIVKWMLDRLAIWWHQMHLVLINQFLWQFGKLF